MRKTGPSRSQIFPRATRKIASYTANLSKAAFLEDEKTFDAVVRNLEVIGEAVKKLPRTFESLSLFKLGLKEKLDIWKAGAPS
ncbi:MAG: hypothetical protein A4E19_12720 [Nitrospira sp. SG-bin1]|nr:MAG: hypothetical protein A4E19_12720 [Nitrospira sp. SG-bin1]